MSCKFAVVDHVALLVNPLMALMNVQSYYVIIPGFQVDHCSYCNNIVTVFNITFILSRVVKTVHLSNPVNRSKKDRLTA